MNDMTDVEKLGQLLGAIYKPAAVPWFVPQWCNAVLATEGFSGPTHDSFVSVLRAIAEASHDEELATLTVWWNGLSAGARRLILQELTDEELGEGWRHRS